MKPELGHATRRLLAGKPGEGNTSKQLAERAAHACERFANHLSRLLGEMGVEMVLRRSISIASGGFPWLAAALSESAARVVVPFREALQPQDPASITEAFVAVMSTLLDLLDRLIGEGLVERLLNEVWPAVFVMAAKDTP